MWGDGHLPHVSMYADSHKTEQELLLRSACLTAALSILGVLLGLVSRAQSLVFDGMFDAIDTGMSLLAWHASRLIGRGADCRFQFGYWHLEPILSLVSSTVRLFVCAYGLLGGVSSLMNGGRVIHYDIAIASAAISTALSAAAFVYIHRHKRGLESGLLDADVRGWLFGALMSGGLCTSFLLAQALEGTSAAWVMPYIDPVVLILLTGGMLPYPIRAIYRAGRSILQVAPRELDQQVRAIASELVASHGFIDHQSYVARIGRARFIEIGFITPTEHAGFSVAELDLIRSEVAAKLGGLRTADWLTVYFTAVRRRSLAHPL